MRNSMAEKMPARKHWYGYRIKSPKYILFRLLCPQWRRDSNHRLTQDISANPHAHDLAAGGGYAHIALKTLVADYLKNERSISVRFEQPLCGYVPDILSKDKQLVAECGHIQNAAKMLDYFHQANIREFMQIPYPDAGDDSVIGYHFVANSKLKEFLDRLNERKNSDIKKILARRGLRDR